MSTPSANALLKSALWNAMRLMSGCAAGALHSVKTAIANGSSPNDGYGTWIPLGWAIRHNATDIAMVLIDAGADVNATENGKSLVSMCLLSKEMESLADTLIERGAQPNRAILAAAAKRGNEKVVQWAIDAGIDANDISRGRDPTLNVWPAKVVLPDGLLRATFKGPLQDDVATKIVGLITRRKNLVLLSYFLEHAQVSTKIKNDLLKLTIEVKWRVGLEVLLKRRYCDPFSDNHSCPSPLVSCANWINSSKDTKNGLKVLDQLISYGYGINSTHRPGTSKLSHLVVDAFLLLRATSSQARPALLSFLVERKLQPIFVGPTNTETLSHALIVCNEWVMLQGLMRTYPGVVWEQAGEKGLLATWARYHTPPNPTASAPGVSPEESLAIVQSLPGFDLQRRTARGETGLRIFMQRPAGSNFTKVATLLVKAGLNPFLPDAEGVSDMTYATTIKLPLGVLAAFEAEAMFHHTPQVVGDTSSGRRRL